ncbi:MAG: 30S ribosomal protein S2 [Anaerolineae bacterium]
MARHVMPMKALLEAGVHFGHRTPRWNPKMKSYIFTQRNGIHIIDLQQTIRFVDQAYKLVSEAVGNGGVVLFVGTKRQAQDSIREEATRCGMPYVNQRWLGGTLTNWRTIKQRIEYLLQLEKQQARGEFSRLVKKEALAKEKEITRLNKRLGGLKTMGRLPNLVFITEIRREGIAVQEANTLGIPILAMVDTNCNPDPIDHIIPSNDDAIRAIRLITSKVADAVLEGQAIKAAEEAEVEEAETVADEDISRYLGPSTLAKLKAAEETEEPAAPAEPAAAAEEETAPQAATPPQTPAPAEAPSPAQEAES